MSASQAQIKDVEFVDALQHRYLAYALSTITSRSLPDVRDGLKPVHRRLLYAMLQLKLDPDKGFKKCARVVGDVIGKYHPHGDNAVYDAMVRMAQHFSMRCPLVEGQGNFGSIDGDAQAAMRYTEARLTEYAMLMLAELENDATQMRDNYDGSESEPSLLPAMIPNILANGSEGIAVGMATSIPPHNIIELLDATLHLMKKPKSTLDDLLKYLVAPDFPTGGVLLEDLQALQQIYGTGRGSLTLQARWHVEEQKNGQYQLIVTEIPYQAQKRQIIEQIAELYTNKKLPLLADFHDLSGEDVRIVFVPKVPTIAPEALMFSLFKLTALQSKVHVNMNVLDSGGSPRVMGLKDILQEFIQHRRVVSTRIAEHEQAKVLERLEVLAGLMVVYDHLDEVIRILKEEDEPKEIMKKRWGLTDIQVEAVLNMRLRSIRKLEEAQLKEECQAKQAKCDKLNELLQSAEKLDAHIIEQLEQIKERLQRDKRLAPRRTSLQQAVQIDEEVIKENKPQEPITILYSKLGWIRAIKGHEQLQQVQYRAGDSEGQVLLASTADKLLCISNQGRVYTISAEQINIGRSNGEPLRMLLKLPAEEDIVGVHIYNSDSSFIFVSEEGKGLIANASDIYSNTKAAKRIMKSNGKVIYLSLTGDSLALLGENRRLLVLDIKDIPRMNEASAAMLQKYKAGKLADIKLFNKDEGLQWLDDAGRLQTLPNLRLWYGKRGDQGRVVLDRIWLDS
ncbi:MAG: DNA topoisomerase IV subunit A [Proteobacteria bacterium]|nr:DNA topoisomerase IV subunit A [Pseudomonadota bacterium]